MRDRDRGIRALVAKDGARPLLAARVERRKNCGNGHRADAVLTDPVRDLPHAVLIEWHDRPTVVIMSAFEHEDGAADALGEIGRPVAERRQ